MIETDMTIFYYKSNGDIYSVCSGIQPIETFLGAHATDLMQIITSIVLPYDQYVIFSSDKFKIDITKDPVTLALIPLPATINTYPVASS